MNTLTTALSKQILYRLAICRQTWSGSNLYTTFITSENKICLLALKKMNNKKKTPKKNYKKQMAVVNCRLCNPAAVVKYPEALRPYPNAFTEIQQGRVCKTCLLVKIYLHVNISFIQNMYAIN